MGWEVWQKLKIFSTVFFKVGKKKFVIGGHTFIMANDISNTKINNLNNFLVVIKN